MHEAEVIPRAIMEPLTRQLESRLGLFFAPAQWAQLGARLAAVAPQFGCSDGLSCARCLLSRTWSPSECAQLIRHLAIGETYFFRDPDSFDCLRSHILPELLRRRRESGRYLRIWSAGCSTGEEPYSVAMLLADMLPDWHDWDIEILGTDMNEDALDHARCGVYSRWSLRAPLPGGTAAFLLGRDGGRQEVHPRLRARVRLARHNLLDGLPASAGPARFDLVLCRNVLIYFDAPRAQAVLDCLAVSVAPGGWLLTNPVEVPLAGVAGLRRVVLPGTVALMREPIAPVAVAPVPQPPRHTPGSAPARPATRGVRASASQPPRRSSPGPVRQACATAPTGGPLQDPRAMSEQARQRADRGELHEAVALCRRAIEAGNQEPELSWLMANALLEQGDEKQALAALRRTLYLEPGHPLAHLALGRLALKRGDTRTSERHLSLALERLAAPGGGGAFAAHAGISTQRLSQLLAGARASAA